MLTFGIWEEDPSGYIRDAETAPPTIPTPFGVGQAPRLSDDERHPPPVRLLSYNGRRHLQARGAMPRVCEELPRI